MEKEYFEKFLESQFENVHSKLDHMTNLQNIANGRTTKNEDRTKKNEDRIVKVERWIASNQGHWSGVNKTVAIVLTLLGIVVGSIITWQFH